MMVGVWGTLALEMQKELEKSLNYFYKVHMQFLWRLATEQVNTAKSQ